MQRATPPFRADHVGSLLRPGAQGGARKARKRRDHRRGTQGGRRPRDRAGHQEAGGYRPQIDHRRRIPPLMVAPRFPLGPRRRREARHGTGVAFAADGDPQRGRPGYRQARVGRAPSDGRAFQIRQGSHEADAKDDYSGAERDLRPADARRRSTRPSIRPWMSSLMISAKPTKKPCAALPTPAAAICSSTKSTSRCCAIRSTATR